MQLRLGNALLTLPAGTRRRTERDFAPAYLAPYLWWLWERSSARLDWLPLRVGRAVWHW